MAAARVAGDAHRRARARCCSRCGIRSSPTRSPSHSEVARNPWRRYQATVAFVTDVTYGDDEVAHAAISRVRARARHGRAASTADGASYSANDPAPARVRARDARRQRAAARPTVYGPRLSPAEHDRYVAEMARVAELLGVDDPPRDAAAASAVLTADRRAGTDAARPRSRVAAHAAAAPALVAPRVRRAVRERRRPAPPPVRGRPRAAPRVESRAPGRARREHRAARRQRPSHSARTGVALQCSA